MKLRIWITAVGLTALLVLGAACSANGAPAASGEEANDEATVGADMIEGSAASMGSTAAAVSVSQESPQGASSAQGNPGATGIWVVGEAVVSVEPDISIVNIGVETIAETVAEARAAAAEAMDAVIGAVKALGLEDKDVQTTSFSIRPQYEWTEVMEDDLRTNKQVLVGYRVRNDAEVKIRDLDAVGRVVDAAAAAGGDATRIHSIRFSIEDPAQYADDLREAAVADAMAKADHFAELAEVTLGQLTYLAQITGGFPRSAGEVYDDVLREAAEAVTSTPIDSGETQLRMSVRAIFAIE